MSIQCYQMITFRGKIVLNPFFLLQKTYIERIRYTQCFTRVEMDYIIRTQYILNYHLSFCIINYLLHEHSGVMKIYSPQKIMPPSGVALGILVCDGINLHISLKCNKYMYFFSVLRILGKRGVARFLLQNIDFKFGKTQKLPGAFLPWTPTPTRALPWTHWGPHSGHQTSDRFMRTLRFHSGYAPDPP